jgi:hypothetical protein
MSDIMQSVEEKKIGETKLHDGDTQSDLDVSAAVVNLNHNESGKVRNPLAGISRSKLLSNVEAFAQEKNLAEHTELLQRGALLAQDPNNYNSIDDLSVEEKAAIENEYTHKWSHPTTLYLTIICCSIGGGSCKSGDAIRADHYLLFPGIKLPRKDGIRLVPMEPI